MTSRERVNRAIHFQQGPHPAFPVRWQGERSGLVLDPQGTRPAALDRRGGRRGQARLLVPGRHPADHDPQFDCRHPRLRQAHGRHPRQPQRRTRQHGRLDAGNDPPHPGEDRRHVRRVPGMRDLRGVVKGLSRLFLAKGDFTPVTFQVLSRYRMSGTHGVPIMDRFSWARPRIRPFE